MLLQALRASTTMSADLIDAETVAARCGYRTDVIAAPVDPQGGTSARGTGLS